MKIVPLTKTIHLRQHRHIIPVFAILLLLGNIVACKDKTPKPVSTPCTICEARTETKHYFLFDIGSWWVYEEETSHQRDSIYMTQSLNDPNSADFDCYMYSTRENYYYRYFPVITVASPSSGCSDDGLSTKKCIYIKRTKTKPGDFIGEETCFFSQFYKGAETTVANVTYDNNKATFVDLLDSYELGNLTFGKTLKIHVDHTALEHNSPVNHYYVKGVGLIRKEIIDSNQVWNLVDYHVTQ